MFCIYIKNRVSGAMGTRIVYVVDTFSFFFKFCDTLPEYLD